MQTKQLGIDLIKSFEKLALISYPDPASQLAQTLQKKKLKATAYNDLEGWWNLSGKPWTIGYGCTHYNASGKAVGPNEGISLGRAEEELIADLEESEGYIKRLVEVKLTQNMFDALVSFVFNVGVDNFSRSTLLKELNKKKYLEAAKEFNKWVYANNKLMVGLVRRRQRESYLFLEGFTILQYYSPKEDV